MLVAVLVGSGIGAGGVRAQTFVQLTELGTGIGARLTRSVTQAEINRLVFNATSGKVTYIDLSTVYQFTADPSWNRVVIWKKDTWTHEYTNESGPDGRFSGPRGVDISARRRFYLADPGNTRVLYATFDPDAGNIVSPNTLRGWLFERPVLHEPVDVAWDGQATPLTTDFLYVLDRENSVVTYWDMNTTPSQYPQWAFGDRGTGVNQFLDPTAICVGKTPGASGGTQFTTNFYVVDNGNRRLVWLYRTSGGAGWQSSTSLGAWDPTDCAVDHFGNVYITDRTNHRIHKFTAGLSLLATYGSFGRGTTNLNTFSFPNTISVPCGLKVVNSQTVWYCEGRVITAEEWGDASGAVEHYLGIDGAITAQPQTDQFGDAWFSFRTTEHAYHTFTVFDVSGNTVRRVPPMGIFPPGTRTWLWDGLRDDGTPAPSGTYWMQVTANSPYGCGGQAWCQKGFSTQTFFHQAGSGCGGGPCSPPIASSDSGSAPNALFLRQRVVGMAQPLARITGPAASAPDVSVTGAAGSLTDLVRQYGVRGLAFGVTASASNGPVAIGVYSLAGRPVRTLVNERLAAGYYEIAWDGLDDRGRPAAPGVYFGVLTAGGERLVQRLILRQGP